MKLMGTLILVTIGAALILAALPADFQSAAIPRPPSFVFKDDASSKTLTLLDGPLAEGWLEGNAIECPRHGARFDVTTGKVLCLPAAAPIKTYPTHVNGDEVQVNVG